MFSMCIDTRLLMASLLSLVVVRGDVPLAAVSNANAKEVFSFLKSIIYNRNIINQIILF